MSLWENLRQEIVGGLRSVGYDLRQRIDMFGHGAEHAYPEYDAYARRPRRALLGGGIAVLAVGGVAGTYFALASGLGGWLLGTPSSGNDPAAPPGAPTVTSAAHAPGTKPRVTAPSPSATGLPPIVISTGRPAAGDPQPPSPVPSPSARATSTPQPSPKPSPPTPSDSPSPSPSESPSPSDSPSSSDSDSPSPSPSSDAGTSTGAAYSAPPTTAARPAVLRSVSTSVSTGA